MADLSKREPGWYWVRGIEDEPIPARWNGSGWCVPTEEYIADDADITTSKRLYPGEDRVREELLAALHDEEALAKSFATIDEQDGFAPWGYSKEYDDRHREEARKAIRAIRAVLAKTASQER